jgi:hypothetical protein
VELGKRRGCCGDVEAWPHCSERVYRNVNNKITVAFATAYLGRWCPDREVVDAVSQRGISRLLDGDAVLQPELIRALRSTGIDCGR